MCSERPTRSGRRGFSLIEVMVVVVILGLLAGAVALKVGDYMRTAQQNRAKSDIATIVDAVETHYLTHSRYPTPDEGLDPLPLKSRNDPWGRPYLYSVPGQEGPFEVYTLGADNREGGEGADADVYSWQLGNESAED